MDKTISFDNRYEKALEYWSKSLRLFERNLKNAEASNNYYNIGRLQFMVFDNKKAACENYDKSIFSHKKYMRKHTAVTVKFDPRFETFEKYINALKKEVGC